MAHYLYKYVDLAKEQDLTHLPFKVDDLQIVSVGRIGSKAILGQQISPWTEGEQCESGSRTTAGYTGIFRHFPGDACERNFCLLKRVHLSSLCQFAYPRADWLAAVQWELDPALRVGAIKTCTPHLCPLSQYQYPGKYLEQDRLDNATFSRLAWRCLRHGGKARRNTLRKETAFGCFGQDGPGVSRPNLQPGRAPQDEANAAVDQGVRCNERRWGKRRASERRRSEERQTYEVCGAHV